MLNLLVWAAMLDILKQSVGAITVVTLVIVGLYLSVKFRFIQLRCLYAAFKYSLAGSGDSKRFSSFSAIAAVLAGNLGVGNIAGIGVALTTGGPGALFWLVCMAMLGAVVKFCGCYLAVIYRTTDKLEPAGYIGGPMYYLANALQHPLLAKLFCVLLITAAFSVGGFVQVNSLVLPLKQYGVQNLMSVSPSLLISVLFAVIVGLVLLGGKIMFSQVVTKLVPVMGLIYIIMCIWLLSVHADQLLPAFSLILSQAFSFKFSSLAGGILGYSMWDAVRVGFDRGILATDAGVGLAPILHAKEKRNKLIQLAWQQGLISMIAPFVVAAICLLTGLVLIVTNSWHYETSSNACIYAFQIGLAINNVDTMLIIILFLFAFTTILTWAYCAETAVHYLVKNKHKKLVACKCFRWVFVCSLPLGAVLHVNTIWQIADICLNSMLIINAYAVVRLYKSVRL